jgi:hypothetical protein
LPRERKDANAPVSFEDSESNIGAHTTPEPQIVFRQPLAPFEP